MKYPAELTCWLPRVEEIVTAWPCSVQMDHVIRWILQFDSRDWQLAVRVIQSLNIIGADDVKNALTVAYSRLQRMAVENGAKISNRNTLFAGLGDAAKSGGAMSYHFRVTNDLSEENFFWDISGDEEAEDYLANGEIKNIVLIDDNIGTGDQATREITRLTEKVMPLGIDNIFVLAVTGTETGLSKIQDETTAHSIGAFEYTVKDTVASLDSVFYKDVPAEERAIWRERLTHYGKLCSKTGLGYGNIGGLVVFYYNTPNTTLPIVWSDMNGWIPLFRRAKRINGIGSYYKMIDKTLNKKRKEVGEQGKPSLPNNALTLYVEGRSDEQFFDLLVEQFETAKLLGVESMRVVAMGGTLWSTRLLEDILKLRGPSVFILDGDQRTKTSLKKFKFELPHVLIEPSIVGLANLDCLKELFVNNELFQRALKLTSRQSDSAKLIDEMTVEELDRTIHKAPPNLRAKLIEVIVQRCLDEQKINKLIEDLRKLIEKQ